MQEKFTFWLTTNLIPLVCDEVTYFFITIAIVCDRIFYKANILEGTVAFGFTTPVFLSMVNCPEIQES